MAADDAIYDDDIAEALSDAVSDGEGHIIPRYVRLHLAKRGLKIAAPLVPAPVPPTPSASDAARRAPTMAETLALPVHVDAEPPSAIVAALRGAEEWLSGWQSAEPYLTQIRAALALATTPAGER